MKHIYWLNSYFRAGYSLKDAADKIRWEGSLIDLRGEAKRHGYRITRKLVKHDVKRVWGRWVEKFTLMELQQIDAWLAKEEYSLEQIIKLCRFHFQTRIKTERDLTDKLMRSGYAWVYALETFKHDTSDTED